MKLKPEWFSQERYFWTVDKTRIPNARLIEDLATWQWLVVFNDWDDFRENVGEVMEQLIAEESGMVDYERPSRGPKGGKRRKG